MITTNLVYVEVFSSEPLVLTVHDEKTQEPTQASIINEDQAGVFTLAGLLQGRAFDEEVASKMSISLDYPQDLRAIVTTDTLDRELTADDTAAYILGGIISYTVNLAQNVIQSRKEPDGEAEQLQPQTTIV